MTWVKLDDGFFQHPKVVRAGRDARDLHLAALCYAGFNLTDGLIPQEALHQLCAAAGIKRGRPEQLAQRLIAVGLWEQAPAGYLIHDFLQFNPSRTEVLEERRANRERVNAWRTGRQKGAVNGAGNGVHAALPTPHVQPTRTPSPSPSTSTSSSEAEHPADPVEPRARDAPPDVGADTTTEPEGSADATPERPAQILERDAYEIADRLGETRERRSYWSDLTVLYRASDLDPPTFLDWAWRACELVARRKAKPERRRPVFVDGLRRLLEEA